MDAGRLLSGQGLLKCLLPAQSHLSSPFSQIIPSLEVVRHLNLLLGYLDTNLRDQFSWRDVALDSITGLKIPSRSWGRPELLNVDLRSVDGGQVLMPPLQLRRLDFPLGLKPFVRIYPASDEVASRGSRLKEGWLPGRGRRGKWLEGGGIDICDHPTATAADDCIVS